MSADPASGTLAQRATRAFGWSFGNTLALRLGTLAIGIALARLLGPEEFGVFAIAMVALMAVLSFNELGVSLAVIRWRDDPATIAPTINTIAVASSAALTAAVFLGAPWLSTLLGDVRAAPVVQVISISILLNGLCATSAAVMQREFLQKKRTIADQVNTWLGAGLSLLFVLLGWGAMSLAVGRLIAALVFGIMIVRWSPVPYRFGWDGAIARRLLGFGLPLAAASLVVFASGYADQIVVGSVLGAQALGFYVLAFNLAAWPVSIFSLPLRAVAPAAFSAMKSEPHRMTSSFTRVLSILSCVAVPACLALSGAAGPVVAFVYGADWMPAAEPLVWLAGLATLRIWFELSYDYLVVAGRSG
ncbi:oligosaccharide flippase family protein, partial [Agrococcus pavilionensis]|uniref:oligosaccharide flippase family protein n=1 Tax=Agrococcus pavilionensis TaxID=1346502 RepID=UPI00059E20FE